MSLVLGVLRAVLAVGLVALMFGLYRLGGARRSPEAPRTRLVRVVGEALAFVAALGGIVGLVALFVVGYHREAGSLPGPVFTADPAGDAMCPRVPPGRPPLIVDVVHGEGAQAWLAEATEQFMRRCPAVAVRLTAHEDLDAARAILRGELRPTVWAPEEDLSIDYLAARWRADEQLFHGDERRSLARSPLVLLAWEDRLRALEVLHGASNDGASVWSDVLCTLVPRAPTTAGDRDAMVPGNWRGWYQSLTPPPRERPDAGPPPGLSDLDPAQLAEWGGVRFMFASPSHAASGAATLVLLAAPFVGDDGAPEPALGDYLERCRAGLAAPPSSARGLAEALRTGGPGRIDGVVLHEHRVFTALERAATLGPSDLRVAYPQPTLIAHYPAVLLWPDDPSRAAELEVARRWLDFVTSEAVQRRAVSFGLRPADPAVALGELDLIDNPFRALLSAGVRLDPPLTEPTRPSGATLRALLKAWNAVIGPG